MLLCFLKDYDPNFWGMLQYAAYDSAHEVNHDFCTFPKFWTS